MDPASLIYAGLFAGALLVLVIPALLVEWWQERRAERAARIARARLGAAFPGASGSARRVGRFDPRCLGCRMAREVGRESCGAHRLAA